MTFRTDSVEAFEQIFNQYKDLIRSADGCTHVSLLRDLEQPTIYFTYSHWQESHFLEKYRKSEVFGAVWPQVKPLFAAPAEAWSTMILET
jgi:quinol monooxygenase YgiN